MYLLCCILHIFKNKDMASTVAAALFHQSDCPDRKQGTPNGYTSEHDHCISDNQCSSASAVEKENDEDKKTSLSAVSWKRLSNHSASSDCCQGNTPRYVTLAEYMLPLCKFVNRVSYLYFFVAR